MRKGYLENLTLDGYTESKRKTVSKQALCKTTTEQRMGDSKGTYIA